jgi:hypothetical protein
MTPRTPQCEVFWALLSSSEHSKVPEDSKPLTFPSVGLHPHTWPKWSCDKKHGTRKEKPVNNKHFSTQSLLKLRKNNLIIDDTMEPHIIFCNFKCATSLSTISIAYT